MLRLAALAAEGGRWTGRDSSALLAALAHSEQAIASLSVRDEARLALDLHAIHARLSEGTPAHGAAASREDAASRRGLASPDDAAAPEDTSRCRTLARRVEVLLAALEADSARRCAADRARIRAGGLRGAELVAWLARHPPAERDAAVEQLLGVAHRPLGRPRLHPELVGYIPSGVAPIVRAVQLAPIGPEDVVIDVGAGLGKVTLLVHLLTGARVRGIELQPGLVAAATERAQALGLDAIAYELADARFAELDGASVVYLYLPFTGATLAAALEQIHAAARQRQLVICTLGLDLRGHGWLRERPLDELWLSIYDSIVPGAAPSPTRSPVALGEAAALLASER